MWSPRAETGLDHSPGSSQQWPGNPPDAGLTRTRGPRPNARAVLAAIAATAMFLLLLLPLLAETR